MRWKPMHYDEAEPCSLVSHPFSLISKTLIYEIQTLDTETGSNAEKVYSKLGWVEVGKIPKYGVSPDGELKDETFFYKQL
jgi:hypothetical protein